MDKQSDKVKLTGLWKEHSKAGTSYLTGNVSPTSKLLILPNTGKKGEHDPDFIAYLTPVTARGKADAGEGQPEHQNDPFA